MDLVPLTQSFKVTPAVQKGNACLALGKYREVKDMGPSRRRVPAHWIDKTLGHEIYNELGR